MAKLPVKNLLALALEGDDVCREVRPYLGMSQIGHECDRYLYMHINKMFKQTITARTQRIFERGDLEEDRVINDLEKIPGITIEGQQDSVSDFEGKFLGHCDGKIIGVPTAKKTWHLLEVKTMNDAAFKKLKKKGMKESNFTYWVQAQMYMGYLKLTRVLWVVTNKNNESRLYIRAKFDAELFNHYRLRAKLLLELTKIPVRIPFGAQFLTCKWCAANEKCYS